MSLYRVSTLADVEFWRVTGGERQRTQLSDLFSATIVLGSGTKASGKVWVRGAEQTFRPGDLLLAEADEIQRITPSVGPIALFTIFWPQGALERAAHEIGLVGLPQWAASQLPPSPLSSELAALHAMFESGADVAEIEHAYWSVTRALLRCASQSAVPSARRTPCHPGVRRAVKRVRSSFAESLSLDDLASELQMSKCHLARCFERSLGVPPHRYRRLLRLQAARRFLEAGHSVGDAANETGFADAPHLTRAFREWLGVSPAAWGSAWRASDPWSERAPQTMRPPKL